MDIYAMRLVVNGSSHHPLWAHLPPKKAVIFRVPSVLDVFAALPLLVALLVPCFFAGVEVFFARLLVGDAVAIRLDRGSPSALLATISSSSCSRLMPFDSHVPGTGNGALSSVVSTGLS